jgi:dTDP-glucose pyrophosphorylase
MARRSTEGGAARPRGPRDAGLAGVLTLAGEGTRMLPWSRGLRKEFLPLFDSGEGRPSVLKPVAHLVVETLMGAGVGDLTLVVRPKDRSTVANYFTVDRDLFRDAGRHPERLAETREFYRRLGRLRIRYAEQPRPTGFGDALLRAAPMIGERPFLLHASDAFLDEPRRGELPGAMGRLLTTERLAAVLLVRRVADPRRYGVVEAHSADRFERWRRLAVTGMEEKPTRPRSHWAATAVYAFDAAIFEALRAARRRAGPAAELEVTWGIQELIDQGGTVAALVAAPPAHWRSVGSPESFYRALRATRRATEG